MPGPVAERRIEVDGVEVFVRQTAGAGLPVVFSHGNPTDSRDWLAFMAALDRPAIAFDYPGWGRSAAPDDFDYSLHGLARFCGRVVETLGVERRGLVVHDWGAVALIDAFRRPKLLDRVVVINSVPLLPGYRWHWLARLWRTPLAGPLLNRAVTTPAARIESRRASGDGGPLPGPVVDQLVESWRSARSRSILDLYRSGDPDVLAAAGHGLGSIVCPSLVVWGERDPYIPARFGRMYAERLPDAQLLELPDGGHWPWIDRPDVIERVLAFLHET